MMSSMSKSLQDYVRYAETAHKAWEDLRMIFVPSVDLRIRQLRQRIELMRQDGDSMARYFGKLKSVWLELGTMNMTIEDIQESVKA
uniref:Retrotransposon gag domain-containing protein n=1 Tax=Brassica oleracea TaxID=3712 RepID=A0A3P6F5W8_BRAOL|nr:unnamed protein product [Brassica oleracea]